MQLVQAEDSLRDAKSKLGSLLYEDNSVPTHNSSSKDHVNEALAKEQTNSVSSNKAVSNSQPSSRPVDLHPEESHKDKANPCLQNNSSGNIASQLRTGSFRPVSKVYELIKHTIATPVASGSSFGTKNIKEEVIYDGPNVDGNSSKGTKRKFGMIFAAFISPLYCLYYTCYYS